MNSVEVEFVLQTHDARFAQYEAICPRCRTGEITVIVKLAKDGQFSGTTACPALCLACEDRLDAILKTVSSSNAPSDRARSTRH